LPTRRCEWVVGRLVRMSPGEAGTWTRAGIVEDLSVEQWTPAFAGVTG